LTAHHPGTPGQITRRLLAWYDRHQRAFPFRGTREPYRVWLSEIMLQQTRTETVGPYYECFLALFPDVHALARASEQEVLKAWEGLGYYNRARNLHKAARLVAGELQGIFPTTSAKLRQLPGVGPYAAAAIASIAYDEPVPAMDGNLNRVISRLFLVEEDIGTPSVRRQLYDLGLSLMPARRAGDMNQALMDLGATICLPGTPDCARCPLQADCKSFQEGDPASLPVMQAKRPPRQVDVAVCLLFCDGKVLLVRRQEALLRGLYVFLLHEGDAGPAAALMRVRRFAPRNIFVEEVGAARHVFTHRVWNMRIYVARATACLPVKDGVWADLETLASLPLPVAMRAAKQAARQVLMEEAGGLRIDKAAE